jgi:hypothetical protein
MNGAAARETRINAVVPNLSHGRNSFTGQGGYMAYKRLLIVLFILYFIAGAEAYDTDAMVKSYKSLIPETLEGFVEGYPQQLNDFMGLMLDFFGSEDSLEINIAEKLPFLQCVNSDDGYVTMYYWDTKNGYRGKSYNTIVQYRTRSGGLKAAAVTSNFYYSSDWQRYAIGNSEYMYRDIVKLKGGVYIAYGTQDNGPVYHFIAIEFLDSGITPYYAFGGESRLKTSFGSRPDNDGLPCMTGCTYNFDTRPYWIEFVFTWPKDLAAYMNRGRNAGIKKEDKVYRSVKFVFNNGKVEGNYEEFARLERAAEEERIQVQTYRFLNQLDAR